MYLLFCVFILFYQTLFLFSLFNKKKHSQYQLINLSLIELNGENDFIVRMNNWFGWNKYCWSYKKKIEMIMADGLKRENRLLSPSVFFSSKVNRFLIRTNHFFFIWWSDKSQFKWIKYLLSWCNLCCSRDLSKNKRKGLFHLTGVVLFI